MRIEKKYVPDLFKVLILIFVLCSFSEVYSQIIKINEIQSSNSSTITDEDGDFSDWIELYNPSDSAVSLAGYYLSDNNSMLYKWEFPDITLESGDFLIVFASGKDRKTGINLHTNFKLDKNGEDLYLVHNDGVELDYFPPVQIYTNYSLGRIPNGNDNIQIIVNPSPGYSNNQSIVNETSAELIFSKETGIYSEPFVLQIFADNESIVYYTLDSSIPTAETGILYTGDIIISKTTVLKAVAINNNQYGKLQTVFYYFVDNDLKTISSDIPLILINSFSDEITDGEKELASMCLINDEFSEINYLQSSDKQFLEILINKRGSTSLSFRKNSYGFHVIDDFHNTKDFRIFDMPEDHNWILYAPYIDRSLIRNSLAYKIAGKMGRYAPRSFFVEVFVNNVSPKFSIVSYHGLYMMTERIKWSENRVNITKIKPDDNNEPEISGGYIFKKDRISVEDESFQTARGTEFAFVRPTQEHITSEQRIWLTEYIEKFEHCLFSENFNNPDSGYTKYIDTDSFIDYFLITELFKEIDGFRLSTFLYKDRESTLVMGPVWDFDLSAGLANYLEGWNPESWYYTQVLDEAICKWYIKLFEDTEFLKNTKTRWWQLRKSIFTIEHIYSLIDADVNIISGAANRNFNKWPVFLKYIWPNWFESNSWEEELDYLKIWFDQRIKWMDTQMGEPIEDSEKIIISYWTFDKNILNNTPLTRIDASFKINPETYIEYYSALPGYPFSDLHINWRKASLERRNNPTSLNYYPHVNYGIKYNENNFRAVQLKPPFSYHSHRSSIVFYLPTTNYSDIEFSFAVRNDIGEGGISIEYSISEKSNQWIPVNCDSIVYPIYEEYRIISISFSNINEVNNNPNFKIRIKPNIDNYNNSECPIVFSNFCLSANNFSGNSNSNASKIENTAFLAQNYPNPVSYSTTIDFVLYYDNTDVNLKIYDYSGRFIKTVFAGLLNSGFYSFDIDISDFKDTYYLYRLTAGNKYYTKKMMILKN